MRTRGTLAGSLLVGSLLLEAPALAAAPVPAPTSSSVTYVDGHITPRTLISAGWQSPSNHQNSWSAGGTGLTGTSTVVDATWTSTWQWVDRDRPGLFVRAEAEHTSYLPGVAATTWSYSVAERVRGGRWWQMRHEEVQPYDPQFSEGSIYSELDTEDSTLQVQYRVHLHAVIQGTYRERLALDVVPLGHQRRT